METLQQKEFNDFFENVRLMRIHQQAYDDSHYTSLRDKLKARDYQKKVDAYIKLQVKLQRSKQQEIFK